MSFPSKAGILLLTASSFLPGCGAWHIREGITALERGATEQAVFHFEKSIQYSPRKATPYTQLGSLHLKAGRYERAIDMLRRAAYLEPRNDAILLNLGLALESRGDREQAAQQYLSILQWDRANAKAHYLLSRLRQREGRLEEALHNAELAIRFSMSEEDRLNYRLSRARILVDLEQFYEALEEIRFVENSKLDAEGIDGLKGAVLVGLGGPLDQAEIALQSAIRKEPSELAHRVNLACLHMKRKRWEEAARELEIVLSRDGARRGIHSQLGLCYEAMGRNELAVAFYTQARLLNPSDPIAIEGLKHLENR